MTHYYKYKSLSGSSFKYFVQMLMDGYIYAPTFDQLNDPMEGAFLSDEILSAEIKQHIKGTKLEKRIVSLVRKENDELPTNMLMWSHYSDEHKGCCLEFHFKNQEDEDNVYEVTYVDSIHAVNQGENDVNSILTRKFYDWAYEHEVRYVGPKILVPITIDKIYLGMKIDDLYRNDGNPNERFFRNLIRHLCPNSNIFVEVMKAEDFDGNHVNTDTNL